MYDDLMETTQTEMVNVIKTLHEQGGELPSDVKN